MMNSYKINSAAAICMIFIMALIPLASQAQSGGYTGSFSRIGLGATGIGMGNAMVAVTDNGAYGYYNPALSALPVKKARFDISSASLEFDRQLHMLNIHFPLPPTAGLNVGLINARVRGIDGRTSSGYHTEMLNTSEYQFLSSFGIRISDNVWGGVGFKLSWANLHEEIQNATSLGFDIGLLAEVHPGWNVGFTIQDLLGNFQWNSSDLYGTNPRNIEQKFPSRFKVGTSYKVLTNVLISSEYEFRVQTSEFLIHSVEIIDGQPRTISDTKTVRTNTQFLRFGSSYKIHERFTLRGGVQFSDLNSVSSESLFSAGFTLHLPFDFMSPSIDYAFSQEPNNVATMHVFALRLSL
jgi:hypothetical protein